MESLDPSHTTPPSSHSNALGDNDHPLREQPATGTNSQSTETQPLPSGQTTSPRKVKISSKQAEPRDPDFVPLMNDEMDPAHTQIAYAKFMDAFVPGEDIPSDKLADVGDLAALKMIYKDNKEEKIYPILVSTQFSYICIDDDRFVKCSAFRKVANVIDNANYLFADVAEFYESKDQNCRPDLAMYPTEKYKPKAALAYVLDEDRLKKWTKSSRCEFMARVSWAWMVIPLEVKRSSGTPGYLMQPAGVDQPFLRVTEPGQLARGQHSKAIAEILQRQHRTHVFSIYIYRQYARLLRWDRTGVIITDVLDLLKDGLKLLNFVYRAMTMTRAQLGFDSTVDFATDNEIDEIQKFKDEVENAYLREYLEDMLQDTSNYPIYKVRSRRHILASCSLMHD